MSHRNAILTALAALTLLALPAAHAQESYDLPAPQRLPQPIRPAPLARMPRYLSAPVVNPPPGPAAVPALVRLPEPVAAPAAAPTPAPVAAVTTLPAPPRPTAAPAVPAAASFRVVRGELIADALERWARAAGWSLEQPPTTWNAPADASFDGDFQQAISALVTQLVRQGAPLQLHLWPANRAALIVRTAP